MARMPLLGVAALAIAAQSADLRAQPAPGSLGGGLIEFLATGRAQAPRPAFQNWTPRQAAPQPPVVAAMPRSAYMPAEPRPPGVDLPMPMRRAALVAPAPQASPLKREIDPQFRRQTVSYDGPHRPGTIIVDTRTRHLLLVQEGGTALRYGIGVGRPGFTWAGRKTITLKKEWPDWRPPPEMLKRRPDLPRFMAGGEDNPLGARALYLGSSLYRIHGTNEPHTIGQAVSSGCFRMMNEDVIDLYGRVRVGTAVVIL